MSTPRAFAILAALAPALFAPRADARPMFMGLGLPEGMSSVAEDISADGTTVVGESDPGFGPTQGFRWTQQDGMVLLGDETIFASGVSADGSVVVGSGGDPNSGGFGAFRWTSAGGIEWLGFLPGASDSFANAVSDDATTIVGTSTLRPFRWTRAGGMVELALGEFEESNEANPADLSFDGSIAVGTGGFSPSTAVMWPSAAEIFPLGFLPGLESESAALAISADGSTIVGFSQGDGNATRAFRWTSVTGMVALDLLPGATRSIAFDVSADGTTIVGGTDLGPFVWDPTNGMRLLEEVLTDLGVDVGGWQLELDAHRLDVSADGKTIVGTARNPSEGREAWIAVIPEPGTALLVAIGLLGLAAPRPRSH